MKRFLIAAAGVIAAAALVGCAVAYNNSEKQMAAVQDVQVELDAARQTNQVLKAEIEEAQKTLADLQQIQEERVAQQAKAEQAKAEQETEPVEDPTPPSNPPSPSGGGQSSSLPSRDDILKDFGGGNGGQLVTEDGGRWGTVGEQSSKPSKSDQETIDDIWGQIGGTGGYGSAEDWSDGDWK